MFRFVMLAALFLLAPGAAAQEVAPFESVALSDGGEVVIVHGPAQRVTIVEGEAGIRVEGGRLLIGDCPAGCRRGHRRLRVEIVTPSLTGVSVADGGVVRTEGAFPRQPAIAASVASGGVIDLRALPAGRARAAVSQGGIILLSADETLDAAIAEGGRITYWGRPRVRSSVRHGGALERGDAADFARPLTELGPITPPVPPLPPVPNLLR